MMNEKVKSIMIADPITIKANDSLEDAKEILKKYRIEHLPVIDNERKLVGIISYYDIWELDKPFEEYVKIKVGDVMTTHVVKLRADDKVGSVAELFLENLFEAIPIVDDENVLVGIVTVIDMIWYEYKKEYPKLFGEFSTYKEYHLNKLFHSF